jgi:PqqD family protein of HPr-rel-A system
MAGAGAPQEASKTPLEGVFCVRQAAALHWRDWGDDSVVYDAYSGQTHQFSPLAAAVMACFEQHACSLDDLAVAIAGDLGVPVDNELRSALRPIVEEFHRLGWIEPTDPIHPS